MDARRGLTSPGRCTLVAVGVAALAVLVLTWPAPTERGPATAHGAQKGRGPVKGAGGLPITGKGPAALAPIDLAIEKSMLRHGVPGAALAVAKDGRLVYARGFGWGFYEKNDLATPQTLFGLASVSKVFTALATLKLAEEGKLRLDDSAFALLGYPKPPPRIVPDPRLVKITVRQLLNHTGGWDREKSGDPINWSFQISQKLGVPMPINEDQLIQFMLGVRLDFDPGTRAVYSNIGYIMLGQIIARITGMPYEQYVRTAVLKPMGIERPRLHDREGRYFSGEARRYNAGLLRAMEAFNMPWADASGGWAGSVVDLARMMTAVDGSRTGKPFLGAAMMKEMLAPPTAPVAPRADGTYYGLGWDAVQVVAKGEGYAKGGSWQGIRSLVKRRFNGIITVAVCNAQAQMDQLDLRVANDALKEVHEAVAEVKEWPKVDLFEEYR